MAYRAPVIITDNLTVTIGAEHVTLSPRQGLELAETLARKSFRRAMAEEVEALTADEQRGGPCA